MKVAIVHDFLNQMGGAERVVAALHRLFPEAPIYTSIADPAVVAALMPDAKVRTSWMQHLPARQQLYRAYLPLYPSAIESLDLSGYDLVISSSSAFAKGARTGSDAIHVCYCHTPMRFAWDFEGYAAREQWGALATSLARVLVRRLRRWDERTAGRPTRYVANSRVVATRIRTCYARDAGVVHPPVDISRFASTPDPGGHFLVVSRLVPYKRIDLAIECFNRIGRELLVVGDGPAREALEHQAGPTIRFLGRQSDQEVAALLAHSRAVIIPGEEDFGITPLEANASGRPVVAFGAGGALETVIPGQTGVLFGRQEPEALATAVEACEITSWSQERLLRHANRFSEAVFREGILREIDAARESPRRSR